MENANTQWAGYSVDEDGLHHIPLEITHKGFDTFLPSIDETVAVLAKLGREDIADGSPNFSKILGAVRLQWEGAAQRGVKISAGTVRLDAPGFNVARHWPAIGAAIWTACCAGGEREAVLRAMVADEVQKLGA